MGTEYFGRCTFAPAPLSMGRAALRLSFVRALGAYYLLAWRLQRLMLPQPVRPFDSAMWFHCSPIHIEAHASVARETTARVL